MEVTAAVFVARNHTRDFDDEGHPIACSFDHETKSAVVVGRASDAMVGGREKGVVVLVGQVHVWRLQSSTIPGYPVCSTSTTDPRNIGVSDRADVYIGHMHLIVVVWFEKSQPS